MTFTNLPHISYLFLSYKIKSIFSNYIIINKYAHLKKIQK